MGHQSALSRYVCTDSACLAWTRILFVCFNFFMLTGHRISTFVFYFPLHCYRTPKRSTFKEGRFTLALSFRDFSLTERKGDGETAPIETKIETVRGKKSLENQGEKGEKEQEESRREKEGRRGKGEGRGEAEVKRTRVEGKGGDGKEGERRLVE